MKLLKSNRVKFLFIALLCLVGGVYLLFNEKGVIRYVELKNEVDGLNEQIELLEKENKKLEGEIDSLKKKIPAKIERTAREKYDMIRPN
ncbi:MAG: septum formation initiator family protein, partial [Ignavibacteriaceae bacterium]|nr:septum formation initiator family protein [Ignavibacteriaceae bacterium]